MECGVKGYHDFICYSILRCLYSLSLFWRHPALFEAVQAVKPEALTFASEGLSMPWIISTIVLNAFGFYLLPQSFTVVLSAKIERSLKKNAITLPLYTILILFAFFIGFAAIILVPGLQEADGDLSLFRLTMQTFDPWFVGIVGGAGLLTALLPVSVMVMSRAVGLMTGFYKLLKPNSSDRQQLTISKLFVLFIILIAFVFSITGGNALAILNIMSYGLITQLVPALIFGFFNTKLMNKYGAIAGILTGVSLVLFNAITSFIILNIFPNIPSAINDINIGFIAIGVNIFIGLSVSLLTNTLIERENSQVTEEVA